MPSKSELISLLEEVLPQAEFYARVDRFLQPASSIFFNSEDYRAGYERVKLNALMDRRMPVPSDFTRPVYDIDRFPKEHFGRLMALVGQLLEPYTDPDSGRFVAVLPAPRVYRENRWSNVESFSKSVVRCAALFGIPETVDTVFRLVEGETAKYTQVVVLDGVSPSLSCRKDSVDLWPGARLMEWEQAFGDPEGESALGIPDAVLTQTSHADTNAFRFDRLSTLLCVDRTDGPLIRRPEDAEPGSSGTYVPVNPHRLSMDVAISALSLAVNHPIVEVCSWHWFDAKVVSLLGYRNELGIDQNMGSPRLRQGRLVGTEDAPLVRDIHERLSQGGGV